MAKKSRALSKLNNLPSEQLAGNTTSTEVFAETVPSDLPRASDAISTPPKKGKSLRPKRKKSALDKVSVEVGEHNINFEPSPQEGDLTPPSNLSSEMPPEENFTGMPANNSGEMCNETPPTPVAEPTVPPDPLDINYAAYEAEVDTQDMIQRRRERISSERRIVFERAGVIAMALACVYLLFLIFGALKTEYVYKDGKLVAQRMTYEELQALDDFRDIQNEYLQARRLYENILQLDYRIAAGIEDPLRIAPEYETILEQVDQLVIQIKALEIKDARYNQLRIMLETWVGTDAAVYCQKMSAAISRNDAKAASDALILRNAMYNDFTIISENIVVLGSDVHGADTADIKNWSPEKYINDNIDGMGGAN